ncbi:ferredoxin [Polaromonas sp. CF318]|uniref:2Fe-2S iron-sulfur cluster-binding protein n=1 Tax=Polaromonas sp. CF318 TaxID=1144318 RepID=UPI000270F9D6|nr:2Fe-2S iron-sulfur cluster-binding protein [Polaromonas sp. CF318]EJL82543.1 ferredoxin [Polaromonas sp. CF318]
MITLHFIAADGRTTEAKGKPGKSLMEAAVAAGIDGIAADCGGLLTCATCHVHVQEPFASDTASLPPPDGEELGMLEFTAAPRSATSRLSCQIKLTPALDGLTVQLPATQY